MALPATLTHEELRDLNDVDLTDYFMDHARMTDSGRDDCRYAIRIGSKTIFDADTHDLLVKFRRAVRRKTGRR
jgi:hypothetical protein